MGGLGEKMSILWFWLRKGLDFCLCGEVFCLRARWFGGRSGESVWTVPPVATPKTVGLP